MENFVAWFGPVDDLLAQNVLSAPLIAYLLLGLVVLNMIGRALEYKQHQSQAASGDWRDVTRHPLRVGTNFLLVVGAFYYMTIAHHGGLVFSTLVVSVFLTDLFEFESRQVEVRNDRELTAPKGAVTASVFALAYILFQTFFFVVAPFWSQVV
ncbi:hypothetical protein BRC71_12035 [Halobacteriales archaeon QH_7_65_31]|nr:MAG: hypothetical protein BRC71_12035 [Halobacteriales archaeon QH_7_65_31]